MDKRFLGKSIETVETTIGELIEAVTQIALEAGQTEEEGYRLASMTLENILRRSRVEIGTIN